MLTKKSWNVIWAFPTANTFFRAKGEIQVRPLSVIPKLIDKGFRIFAIIPFEAALLPKTKLAPSRIHKLTISLKQKYQVTLYRLTRTGEFPTIFMADIPQAEESIKAALFSKLTATLPEILKKEIDVYHLFDWQTSLVPYFLEQFPEDFSHSKKARTFLTLGSLESQGNFAPKTMSHIGIPQTFFHPEAFEFYGQFSFLKVGLLFSDGISIVDRGTRKSKYSIPFEDGVKGILHSQLHKLRQWASDRSVKNHLEAYFELINSPKPSPFLPVLESKIISQPVDTSAIIQMWGPDLPGSYGVDSMSLMVQSPTKAYTFWEWVHEERMPLGLLLENISTNKRDVLAKGISPQGEFWLDVLPDHEYVVELITWDSLGKVRTLFRSNRVKTPRDTPSPNKEATFIDTRNLTRYTVKSNGTLNGNGQLRYGQSSFELITLDSFSSSWLSKTKS